jgi:hypothetical protein
LTATSMPFHLSQHTKHQCLVALPAVVRPTRVSMHALQQVLA